MSLNMLAHRVRNVLPLGIISLVRPFRGVGRLVTSDYLKHLNNREFMSAYQVAKAHTLVDILRLHELWSVVQQTAKLEPGAYLEVGVWRGGSGLIIAKAMQHSGIAAELYLADTFEGVVKTGERDNTYAGGEHADTSAEAVERLLRSNGVSARLLKGIFPDATADQVTGPLRMLHVDVDVYQSAKDIVTWAAPRMVAGGVVVFDDYGFQSCAGVTALCEEYEQDPRFIFVHNLNGHALLIKR